MHYWLIETKDYKIWYKINYQGYSQLRKTSNHTNAHYFLHKIGTLKSVDIIELDPHYMYNSFLKRSTSWDADHNSLTLI